MPVVLRMRVSNSARYKKHWTYILKDAPLLSRSECGKHLPKLAFANSPGEVTCAVCGSAFSERRKGNEIPLTGGGKS